MRLAIADPPYLGRAAVWYGDAMTPSQRGKNVGGAAGITGPRPADHHPDAALWDDIDTHARLISDLIAGYDGWAMAMAHDNLRSHLPLIPAAIPVRIGIWRKTQLMPGGARVVNVWEPVVLRIPEGRRESKGQSPVHDHMTCARLNDGFPGAKPSAWTRWVLDMLGYDQHTDTVADLFPGSGAVGREVSQLVIDL